jgi:hypothetical protein
MDFNLAGIFIAKVKELLVAEIIERFVETDSDAGRYFVNSRKAVDFRPN